MVSFFHDQNDKSKLTQLTSRDMMRDRSFAANISVAHHESVKVLAKTGQVKHKLFVISNVPDFQKIVQCLMYSDCSLNNYFVPLKVLPRA